MDQPAPTPLELNRRNWDDRARIHGQDRIYDSRALIAGASSLTEVELEALGWAVGDVNGLEVIHLQCHIGFDSISLARMGAVVTGLDFSPVALAKAADLARRCAVRLDLVQSEVCDPPARLHQRFDLAYATIGVLCWIEDVGAWMRAAFGLLRPGGRLVLVEMHPLQAMIDTVDPLVLDIPYNFDGPHVFDSPGSYTDRDAPVDSTSTVEYSHGLGEVVSAAIDAGFEIRRLAERTDSPCDHRGDLGPPDPDGRHRLRLGGGLVPLLYTLVARRP